MSLNNKNSLPVFIIIILLVLFFMAGTQIAGKTTHSEQLAFKYFMIFTLTIISAFLLRLFFRKTKTAADPKLEKTADLESAFRLFNESADELLWHIELNSGKITFMGPEPGLSDISSSKASINRQVLEFLTLQHQPVLKKELTERVPAYENGDERLKVGTSEIAEIYTDGTAVSAEIKTILIKNKDNKVTHLAGKSSNISKIRQAEQRYIEIQTQIEAIFNGTDDLIWTVDPVNFGLITYNDSFRNYFLKKRGIVISTGMTPEDLVPPEYTGLWQNMYNTALENGSYVTEYTTVSMSHALLVTLNTLRHDEKVFGISVFARDIAAQKTLEKMLLENERKYRDIFRIFPHPALIFKLCSGIYLEVNSEFEKMSGYSRADIIGKSDFALNLWTEPEKRNGMISKLKSTGYIKEQLLNMRRKDGTEVNCAISASVIEIEGSSLGLLVLKQFTEIEDVIQLLSHK